VQKRRNGVSKRNIKIGCKPEYGWHKAEEARASPKLEEYKVKGQRAKLTGAGQTKWGCDGLGIETGMLRGIDSERVGQGTGCSNDQRAATKGLDMILENGLQNSPSGQRGRVWRRERVRRKSRTKLTRPGLGTWGSERKRYGYQKMAGDDYSKGYEDNRNTAAKNRPECAGEKM